MNKILIGIVVLSLAVSVSYAASGRNLFSPRAQERADKSSLKYDDKAKVEEDYIALARK
jgi:hypothetical protein